MNNFVFLGYLKNPTPQHQWLKRILLMFFGAFLLASCAKERQIGDRMDQLHLETESRIDTFKSCLDKRPFNPEIITCAEGILPINFQLPQYPGCQFFGTVEYVHCAGLLGSYMYVGDLVINYADNCPQYYTDLASAQANGTLVSFHRTFMGAVYNVATDILLNTVLPSTESLVRVEHHLAACISTCWKPANTDGTGSGGPTGGIPPTVLLVPVDTPCDDACCIRTATYRKIEGVWHQDEVAWDSAFAECPDIPSDCYDPDFSIKCSGGCNFF